ncbi:MAG: hypothetical protein FWF46_04095 [Oscillospiraceae bacterium]|nr:hypothetical protein [Oscillospiraceae bacterium]
MNFLRKNDGITLITILLIMVIILILVFGIVYISNKKSQSTQLSDTTNGNIGNTDGSWNGTVDAPKLVAGMTAVGWDSYNNEIAPTTQNDWYNYMVQPGTTDNGGTSKWANAKTSNGSYLVWIPRYEYKITDGLHGYVGTSGTGTFLPAGAAGTIDVKFIPVTQTTADNGYKIHPAFTNSGNGGFGELSGIWVGKYASSNDGSGNVKIISNVVPWINITVNDVFNTCRTFSTNNSLAGMDSHMMKNTEWGAVAYLTQSQYGRNGTEVTINNYYVGGTPKTGYAGDFASEFIDTTGSNSYPYNTTQGVLASTTGNITGVYDMSGGVWEYVAAYVNNGDSSLNSHCLSLINAATKYKDVYTVGNTDSQANNYAAASSKYGDALYETSFISGLVDGGWFEESSLFPYATEPIFIRRR